MPGSCPVFRKGPPFGWFAGYGNRLHFGVAGALPGERLSTGQPHKNGFGSHTLFPKRKDHPKGGLSFLEQDTGVEPAFTAWEAVVLPIYESCVVRVLYQRDLENATTFCRRGILLMRKIKENILPEGLCTEHSYRFFVIPNAFFEFWKIPEGTRCRCALGTS